MYFFEYDEAVTRYQTAEARYMEWMNKLISATTPLNDWNYTQSIRGHYGDEFR